MTKMMQNLVFFMEPSEDAWQTSLKGGNILLNRFCIDEDAAFELSGVNYLKKSNFDVRLGDGLKSKIKRKVKGKEYIIPHRVCHQSFPLKSKAQKIQHFILFF